MKRRIAQRWYRELRLRLGCMNADFYVHRSVLRSTRKGVKQWKRANGYSTRFLNRMYYKIEQTYARNR